MRAKQAPAKDIEEYIAGFPSNVQKILQEIGLTIREAAPGARRGNQISDTGVHSKRQSDLFCRLQEILWTLSGAEGSGEVQEGVVWLMKVERARTVSSG